MLKTRGRVRLGVVIAFVTACCPRAYYDTKLSTRQPTESCNNEPGHADMYLSIHALEPVTLIQYSVRGAGFTKISSDRVWYRKNARTPPARYRERYRVTHRDPLVFEGSTSYGLGELPAHRRFRARLVFRDRAGVRFVRRLQFTSGPPSPACRHRAPRSGDVRSAEVHQRIAVDGL